MMRAVRVVDPGMYTTVQDGGRPGFLRYGLPRGGVMDRIAYHAANAALGNVADSAVLEATGTMPTLEFMQDEAIAVADRAGVARFDAQRGQRLVLGPVRQGYRACIAFAGGIDVPVVMGSRSTYLPGRIGGLEGRILHAGDLLPLGDPRPVPGVKPQTHSAYDSAGFIHVIPGPEAAWFDCGGLHTFLSESFTISARSDRTGLRLEGPELSFRSDAQMVSAGLSFGTIQVPPSGVPIIMMADHPTTGGYPRIGNVVQSDLPLLAQLRPGEPVRFQELRTTRLR